MASTLSASLSEAELEALLTWATPARAASLLQDLANTPAPSQTPAWLRGPIIQKWWQDVVTTDLWSGRDIPNWNLNYQKTGNGVLELGNSPAPIWLVAHWDCISYLIANQQTGGSYKLVPFCLHTMMDGQQPASVLGYSTSTQMYKVIARGTLYGGEVAYFKPDDASISLRAGQRIVIDVPMKPVNNDVDDYLYSGQMDNAAGCVAVLLAAAFLAGLNDVSALVALTDEEEGVLATGNTSFSRGAQRLLSHLPAPDLAIISDLHTASDTAALGQGASLAEYASQTRGAVTPPWLYETLRDLTSQASPDILLNEVSTSQAINVSRSDDVSLMNATPNVVLCGVPAIGRHFADGPDVVSAVDIAHTARSLVLIACWAARAWLKS
ncbi:MAG: hypothetical protein AAF267_17795 [Deinococcota bacterium]